MGYEIIRKLREERGWTLRELAKHMGSYPQQISKYELGQNALTIDWIKKFANVFGVPASAFMDEDSTRTQRFNDNTTKKLAASEHETAPPWSDIPAYGSTATTDDRIENIDTSRTALDMRALRNSFAVMIAGNNMEPRYRHGDYALVLRNEWPQPYQDCLIVTHNGEGFVKTYITHNDKKLTCEQLNPRQKWEMPMAKVKAVHLIRGRWK